MRIVTIDFSHHASRLWPVMACVAGMVFAAAAFGDAAPQDPGVQLVATRGSAPAACPNSTLQPFDPAPIAGLTPQQLKFFCAGLEEFRKPDAVKDGLGPTMNLDSCVGCHAYPAAGGTSPPKSIGNPQIAFLRKYRPGTNTAPSFITQDGPVREVRFIHDDTGKPDGGVHSLFTITGLPDANGCDLKQPDFAKEYKGIGKPGNNAIFRIPTPVFGLGLIEQIEDSALIANQAAKRSNSPYDWLKKVPVGHLNLVRVGHTNGAPNRNGNDGTIARFGWKAQNKSLLVFAGEAYNVEMGISNELFETERNEDAQCQFHTVPNDTTASENLAASTVEARYDAYSDIEKFAAFMRYSAPPMPSSDTPGGAESIGRGKGAFFKVGCSHCHTPELHTSANGTVAALRGQPVRLFSDLALHDMGSRLADGISQGQASGREFRSAPLWGLGQRSYFLHDGRTSNLIEAIEAHYSAGAYGKGGSEANVIVDRYRRLDQQEQQDLLNFLRSL